jgi:hypothetical protein
MQNKWLEWTGRQDKCKDRQEMEHCQNRDHEIRDRTAHNIHCNENPIYVFLFWELYGLSPNLMCLLAIYIFPGPVHIFPAAE